MSVAPKARAALGSPDLVLPRCEARVSGGRSAWLIGGGSAAGEAQPRASSSASNSAFRGWAQVAGGATELLRGTWELGQQHPI